MTRDPDRRDDDWLGDDAGKDWEIQSAVDTLLRLQNREVGLSDDFRENLRRRCEEEMPVQRQRKKSRSVYYISWLAGAAALVAIGLLLWLANPNGAVPDGQPGGGESTQKHLQAFALGPGWRGEGRGVDCSISQDGVVRLNRGELYVESIPLEAGAQRGALTIQTPEGTAKATGTQFYIGTHEGTSTNQGVKMTRITRVLVLTGIVALTNPMGTVTGGANDLLAAESNAAPVKIAVQANSDFAFDMYNQLARENEGKNLFFSPYSISSALAMTAEGARGKTAVEMGEVLRFPDEAKRVGDDAQLIPWRTSIIHAGMGELNDRLTGGRDKGALAAARAEIERLRAAFRAAQEKTKKLRSERKWQEYRTASNEEKKAQTALNQAAAQVDQYELRTANALWGEKTYPFAPDYIDTVAKYYKTGGVFPADFLNNFPKERDRVNGWVANQTNDRIKDIIPELPPDEARLVRLILTNAIYFKGEWSVPFEDNNTKPRDFTLASGAKERIPIMNAQNLEVGRYGAFNAGSSSFNTPQKIRRGEKVACYPGDNGFAVLELPYKGDDLSMVLIAPNRHDGLDAIEKDLVAKKLSSWIGQLKKRKVHVFLPKFKMETDYKLGDSLEAMGMVRAFTDPRDPKGADFTGMCASDDPRLRLYISKVLHKAFVEVNEKGTEAAAATAVMMKRPTSLLMSRPFTPTFKADRPFLFLIRDIKTGSILFMGRMTQPAE